MRKQDVVAPEENGDLRAATLARSREITLDSPIEDLKLSRRVQNALEEAACVTVRSLLDHDFLKGARQLGPIAKKEILSSLSEHGFGIPAALMDARNETISKLEKEIGRLRDSIETSSRQLQGRVKRLEDRVNRLSIKEESP